MAVCRHEADRAAFASLKPHRPPRESGADDTPFLFEGPWPKGLSCEPPVSRCLPFESLAYRHRFQVADFPPNWLPLFSVSDPDLLLFPIAYFHALTPDAKGGRPSYADRVFGYIERLNLEPHGLDVYVVCNKNVEGSLAYRALVEKRVREMLGLDNPVRVEDVRSAFTGTLSGSNAVLEELWHRVIGTSYGGSLPFGSLWDPVFGLARFVASLNSPSGRKGELIQTHYFASRFGEKIQSAGELVQNDFFLLPTFEEVRDSSNPLLLFPRFARLLEGARTFAANHGRPVTVGSLTLTGLRRTIPGRLNHAVLDSLIADLPEQQRIAITEAFNAFDKGPPRTVAFLLLLADLADRRLRPEALTAPDMGHLYDDTAGSYQSRKVIALYAQQCFGNPAAIPVDLWVNTLFRFPLYVYPTRGKSIADLLANSINLGRVERLLWTAVQARKVHSSACNDAIWCTKYNSASKPRGANPLACKICILRRVCPAFAAISEAPVAFNGPPPPGGFVISTSAGDNTTQRQRFVRAEGPSKYGPVMDDFSPVDEPDSYRDFPSHDPNRPMTVKDFVDTY